MFSSCYSKKYCIFVEKRLHLSNRSKLHCIRFALFLHLKGVFFLRVHFTRGNKWWDMTTHAQWQKHVNKYGKNGTLLNTAPKR